MICFLWVQYIYTMIMPEAFRMWNMKKLWTNHYLWNNVLPENGFFIVSLLVHFWYALVELLKLIEKSVIITEESFKQDKE